MTEFEMLPANRISLRHAYDLMLKNERVIHKNVRVDMMREENLARARSYVFDYAASAIASDFLKKGVMKFRERELTENEKRFPYGDELVGFEARAVVMSVEDAETIRAILQEAMRVLGGDFQSIPRSIP